MAAVITGIIIACPRASGMNPRIETDTISVSKATKNLERTQKRNPIKSVFFYSDGIGKRSDKNCCDSYD